MNWLLSFMFSVSILSAHARGVSFGVDNIEGQIRARGLIPDQGQVTLRCQFERNGRLSNYSEKQLSTTIKVIETKDDVSVANIQIFGKTLRDYLPGHQIHNCSFTLLLLAKDMKKGYTVAADLVLLGQMEGKIDPEKMKLMSDKKYATEAIHSQLNPLEIQANYSRPQTSIEVIRH